jgi:hypothetical protein
MKNILVKSLFEIKDPNWSVKDRSAETDLYKKYVECHQISLGSFKKHLKATGNLHLYLVSLTPFIRPCTRPFTRFVNSGWNTVLAIFCTLTLTQLRLHPLTFGANTMIL